MIKLPDDLIQYCEQWAERTLKHGIGERSLALSVRGAEKNVLLWTESKMAECVFAVECGLDPLACLNWSGNAELDGIDLTVGRTTVDVKYTFPHYRYLIWSRGKNHTFASKQFHVLVLVKLQRVDCGGESYGWISRRAFGERRRIADEDHDLDEGTMYMHQDELCKMDCFPGRYPDRFPLEHYCWCGEHGVLGFAAPQPREIWGWYCCKDHVSWA